MLLTKRDSAVPTTVTPIVTWYAFMIELELANNIVYASVVNSPGISENPSITADDLEVNEPLITIRNGYRQIKANSPTNSAIKAFPNEIFWFDLLITHLDAALKQG
jgi:hypothetical protein